LELPTLEAHDNDFNGEAGVKERGKKKKGRKGKKRKRKEEEGSIGGRAQMEETAKDGKGDGENAGKESDWLGVIGLFVVLFLVLGCPAQGGTSGQDLGTREGLG
jgi:hypothetical protein